MLANQSSCILLVEDDPLVRERLEALISAAGFGVISVGSCGEARAAASALVFPIMIIDRMLGDGDGMDLIAELRRQCAPSEIFMMLLSARDASADLEQGMKAGADEYLSKRASDEELLKRLRSAIRTVRLRTD
jgi:DNA-binding response OmpR family regulator